MDLKEIFKTAAETLIPARFHLPIRLRWRGLTRTLDEEMFFVSRLLGSKRRFIDIGANVGIYSYFFSELFENVEAFEPLHEITYRLAALDRNGINVHNVALSDTHSMLTFYIPLERGKLVTGLASLEKRASPFVTREVLVKTLDEYQFSDVDLIKIDVEGHEASVIRGARQTLETCRPVLIVEIEQRHLTAPIGDVFDLIVSQGYRGGFLLNGDFSRLDKFDYETHQRRYLDDILNANYVNNFIFVPKEREGAARWAL